MYGTDYSRWDNIKDSDDDATAPAPAPLPPQKPQSDQPLDPTNVAAMRELLHEIDDGRRPHLLAAIEWVEAARATLDRGEAVDDGQCPFDRGSEPWFWFLLLANKPHITLHGPHKPRLARQSGARGSSARSRASCARTPRAARPAASGSGRRLRRCSACCCWYCGKECQRVATRQAAVLRRRRAWSARRIRGPTRAHAAECRKGRKELRDAVRAAEARRLDGLLPANGDRPALRARHRLDGYGKSAMVLYEAAAVDDIYGVVTRPCHDAGMRERFKSGEAIFNVGDYADVGETWLRRAS